MSGHREEVAMVQHLKTSSGEPVVLKTNERLVEFVIREKNRRESMR
jgi:hypothetical protein